MEITREFNFLYELNEKGTNRWMAHVQPCGPESASEEELIAIARMFQNSPDVLEAAKFAFGSLQKVYQMMNSLAKNEHMKDWSCTDYSAVVAQIYGDLAPAFNQLKEALKED